MEARPATALLKAVSSGPASDMAGSIFLSSAISTSAIGSAAFCVYATTATYDITITSSNGGGGFVFTATGQAAPLQTVTYGVKFDDDLTPNDGADVQEGVTIPGVTNPVGGVPPACAVGSNNASIEVTFPAGGNLDSALVDTYEDTLTMLIEPV